MPCFPTLEIKEAGCISDAYFTLDYLRKVRKLLTQYKYDIPIVSVMTGNEFQDPGKVKTIEKIRIDKTTQVLLIICKIIQKIIFLKY